MTMHYELVKMEPVTIAGITVRTDNSEARMQKIQQLWGQLFQQGITAKVARAVDPAIYEAYFDYESDANGAYTLMLGNRVSRQSEKKTDHGQAMSVYKVMMSGVMVQ